MALYFIKVNPYCSQIGLLKSEGYLYSYSEFLNTYNIPVTPREFAIVMDTIPCGAITLLKGSTRSQSSFFKDSSFWYNDWEDLLFISLFRS